mmetsp:Transcript_5937/g.6629  ORF Transcript_5937/g.6629 Transcript_5937/m.6629 type:complete len:289 (-) Transcript_5937:266-1132(-)
MEVTNIATKETETDGMMEPSCFSPTSDQREIKIEGFSTELQQIDHHPQGENGPQNSNASPASDGSDENSPMDERSTPAHRRMSFDRTDSKRNRKNGGGGDGLSKRKMIRKDRDRARGKQNLEQLDKKDNEKIIHEMRKNRQIKFIPRDKRGLIRKGVDPLLYRTDTPHNTTQYISDNLSYSETQLVKSASENERDSTEIPCDVGGTMAGLITPEMFGTQNDDAMLMTPLNLNQEEMVVAEEKVSEQDRIVPLLLQRMKEQQDYISKLEKERGDTNHREDTSESLEMQS